MSARQPRGDADALPRTANALFEHRRNASQIRQPPEACETNETEVA
jgi:hypothetical protein